MEDRRKRIPWWADAKVLAVILTIFSQTIYGTAWAVRLEGQVDDHERRILIGEALDSGYSKSSIEIVQRLSRVEERQSATFDLVKQIDSNLQYKGAE